MLSCLIKNSLKILLLDKNSIFIKKDSKFKQIFDNLKETLKYFKEDIHRIISNKNTQINEIKKDQQLLQKHAQKAKKLLVVRKYKRDTL